MNEFLTPFNHMLGSSLLTIIGAVLIFLVGCAFAALIGSATRHLLAKLNVNQRMNASTGKQFDIERLLARIVFWFVFVIGVSSALSSLRLDTISLPFASMISQVLLFIPNLMGAAAVAMLGWVLATIARSGLNAVLSKTTLDEKLSEDAGVPPISETVANVVYWFILLMFLPMVLAQLGLTGLLEPISQMIGKVLNFVPNIFVAGLFIFVGYITAKILRGIVTNLIASFNIQSIAQKAGISNHTKIANMAGTLVYLLVMITAIILGLNALKIEVISAPATNMLNQIMSAIPHIIAAVAILGIAYYVVKFIANIVSSLLENSGINNLPAKFGVQDIFGKHRVSDMVGHLIVFFAMLFASIEAANRLGFGRVSDLLASFITFGADIVLGAVILCVGFWLANLLAGVVKRSQQGSNFIANLVRVLIMGLVLAMGLKAMGIADSIVNLAFGLTLGAVAVAFALAFGLGGREVAGQLLQDMRNKMTNEKQAKKQIATEETEDKS